MSDRLRELDLDIADNGGWEEFHQKRGDYFMYDHHKSVRLRLEREYKNLTVRKKD